MQNTNLSVMVLGSHDPENTTLNLDEMPGNPKEENRLLLLSPEKTAYFTDGNGNYLDGETICGRFIITSTPVEEMKKSPQFRKLQEIEKMRDYGYFGEGDMIPISKETALRVCKMVQVFMLYDNDDKDPVIQLENPNFIDASVLENQYEEAKRKIDYWSGDDGLLGIEKEDVILLWDSFSFNADLNTFELSCDWLGFEKGTSVKDIEAWFVQSFGCSCDFVQDDIHFPF